jgi:hypothetical protein
MLAAHSVGCVAASSFSGTPFALHCSSNPRYAQLLGSAAGFTTFHRSIQGR